MKEDAWAYSAAAKSLQSCLTLCNPVDGSPPGSAVPGILQARTLEWVAISFSNAWKWKGKVKSLSRVRLFKTPWTAAYQAPPSMGFSRQEYWSGLLFPPPGDLPSPRIKLIDFLHWWADSLPLNHREAPWVALNNGKIRMSFFSSQSSHNHTIKRKCWVNKTKHISWLQDFSELLICPYILWLSPGDIPDPVIEPGSPALQADSLPSDPPGKF